MKKLISIILIIALSMSAFGCASVTGDQRADTGGLGAIIGGIAGYLITGRTEGALIGAAIGGAAGFAIGAIAKNAAEEAAKTDKPVEYKSENGNSGIAQRVAVDPVTGCSKVSIKEMDANANLVVDTTKDICPVAKTSQPATTGVN
jgi:hypothetical protein